MSPSVQAIRDTFATLRRTRNARHRDIADEIGISEGALIAAHAGLTQTDSSSPMRATRLEPAWPQLIASLSSLGRLMALTRNASCVHETTGIYSNTSHNGQTGSVQGEGIDVALFYQQWAHGFGVVEQTTHGLQRSLQFFDAQGTAIHKVFMTPSSDLNAYANLIETWTAPDQTPGVPPPLRAEATSQRVDAEVNVAELHRAWDALRYAHDFECLLHQFGITHQQALRLADPLYTQMAETDDCQSLLHAAAAHAIPIKVLTGNAGALQSHTGLIKRVVAMGPWINVLDPAFNLHLREDDIASAWVVKKPTVHGLVTSLELFDANGEAIAMFYGAQKPGMPEMCEWRDLIQNTLQEPHPCPT